MMMTMMIMIMITPLIHTTSDTSPLTLTRKLMMIICCIVLRTMITAMIYDDYDNYNTTMTMIMISMDYTLVVTKTMIYNTPVDKIIDKHVVIDLLLMIKMMIAMISFPMTMMTTTNVLLFKLHNDKQMFLLPDAILNVLSSNFWSCQAQIIWYTIYSQDS